MMRFRAQMVVVALFCAALLVAHCVLPAKAEAAPLHETLTDYVDYYSRRYSSEVDPYSIYTADELWTHVMRVSLCETINWTDFVGDHGNSIGPMQMHVRGIWWSSPQARAGYSRGDYEANIAAGAYFISRGYGPDHWVYCWRNGWRLQP